MPRYQSPPSANRRPSSPYSQTSDAILFGLTRGASGLPRRDPGCSGRQLYRAEETFEDTYPRFEFSTLVALSLDCLRWLIGVRQRAAAADRAASRSRPAAAGIAEITRTVRRNRAGWRQQNPLHSGR